MEPENNGIADAVEAELNPQSAGPSPDAKGPDPEQWPADDRSDSEDSEFVEATDKPKGPDPDEWSEEARAARGADNRGVEQN